ncbi:hypothetical protein ACH42_11455 [Endozoicomonas sp. (ex Bugula neritina AB1)]|nr:hypothetical protein ACH42_11455 [Endozoicomonas sp. (ex Bugula neritina AB1)]
MPFLMIGSAAPTFLSQSSSSETVLPITMVAFLASMIFTNPQPFISTNMDDENIKTEASVDVELPIQTEPEVDEFFTGKPPSDSAPWLSDTSLSAEEGILFLHNDCGETLVVIRVINYQNKTVYIVLLSDGSIEEYHQANDGAATALQSESQLSLIFPQNKIRQNMLGGDECEASSPCTEDGEETSMEQDETPLPEGSGVDESSQDSRFIHITNCPPNELGDICFRDLKDFLTSGTAAAEEWGERMSSQYLENPDSLSMPCMKEIMTYIEKKIGEFKELSLTKEDGEGLDKYQTQLNDCRKQSYPYKISEQSILCFNYIHEYVRYRYYFLMRTAESTPNIYERDLLRYAWKDFLSNKHSINTILSIPWRSYRRGGRCSDIMFFIGIVLDAPSLNTFGRHDALQKISEYGVVRIYTFEDLSVYDVLRNSALLCSFVGLSRDVTCFHDGLLFRASSFTWHDCFHNNIHCRRIMRIGSRIGYHGFKKFQLVKLMKRRANQAMHEALCFAEQQDEQTKTLLLLILFEIFHEDPYCLYIKCDSYEFNIEAKVIIIIEKIEKGLQTGGKYNGGGDCETTKKYINSLSKKEEVKKMLRELLPFIYQCLLETRL